ncbi:hypothetical protein DL93DRAFT_762092 [Clavulina sp. PMI_390]|nr:hypothetical protein DL93DRAFT_762092 [Clavulina sp. PMI_390]
MLQTNLCPPPLSPLGAHELYPLRTHLARHRQHLRSPHPRLRIHIPFLANPLTPVHNNIFIPRALHCRSPQSSYHTKTWPLIRQPCRRWGYQWKWIHP